MIFTLFNSLGLAFTSQKKVQPAKPAIPVHISESNKWEKAVSSARRAASVIPSNSTKLTDDGYTVYEMIMGNQLSDFAKTQGIHVSSEEMISLINSAKNDVALVDELVAIEKRHEATREKS